MAEPLTDEQLAEIDARANAATPGPWSHCLIPDCIEVEVEHWDLFSPTHTNSDGTQIGDSVACHTANGEDAEFIKHSRADVPALLAEVRRLRAENAELRAEAVQLRYAARDTSPLDDDEGACSGY